MWPKAGGGGRSELSGTTVQSLNIISESVFAF